MAKALLARRSRWNQPCRPKSRLRRHPSQAVVYQTSSRQEVRLASAVTDVQSTIAYGSRLGAVKVNVTSRPQNFPICTGYILCPLALFERRRQHWSRFMGRFLDDSLIIALIHLVLHTSEILSLQYPFL